MQFEQHQGRTHVSLQLRDEDFVYAFRQGGRQFTETFPYPGWPFEGEAFQERAAWLGWAGWLSTAVGLLWGGWSPDTEERLREAAPWLVAALGLHAACARTTRSFSRFMVGPYPVLLLRDAQHDTIADELARRRTAYLRRYLVDAQQPRPRPQVHQRRLDWLRASGVITDDEYQQATDAMPAPPLPDARRA